MSEFLFIMRRNRMLIRIMREFPSIQRLLEYIERCRDIRRIIVYSEKKSILSAWAKFNKLAFILFVYGIRKDKQPVYLMR